MTGDRHTPDLSAPPSMAGVAISRADLELLAALSAARFADAEAEAERAKLVIRAHAAGQALGGQLSRGSRHALSESRGSHSAWDVAADLRAAFDALAAYAQEVRAVVERYGAAGVVAPRVETEQEIRPVDRRLHAI